MKQFKFLSIVSVLFAAVLLSSCVKEPIDNGGNAIEGEGAKVKLSLKSPESTKTRAALTEAEEQTIDYVDVLIFNQYGGIVTNQRYPYSAGGVEVETFSGNNRTIYIIANADDRDDLSFSTAISAVRKLSDLESIVLTMDGTYEFSRKKLLSTGSRTGVTIQPGANPLSGGEIALSYVSARIDFTVNDETPLGDYFVATSWDVVDIPVKSYIIDQSPSSGASVGTDAVNVSTATDFYTSNGSFDFDYTDDTDPAKLKWSSSFYSLENRRGGRVARSPSPPNGGGISDGSDQNKAWYAPDKASYIIIEGMYYSASGNSKVMTMKIYLGEDNNSNYNVRRGYNQQIIIRVAGVNNITVDTNVEYTDSSFDVQTGSDLTMDGHPDYRVLRIIGKAKDLGTPSLATVEILDASGNAAGEVGFSESDVSWLKLSPLNLYRHQVKQMAVLDLWQQQGQENGTAIAAGHMVRPKYIPHKSVRAGIGGYTPPSGITLGAAGYPVDDDVLAFVDATFRMSYTISDIPFANFAATSNQSIFVYADELLSGTRTATVRVTFNFGIVAEIQTFTILQSAPIKVGSYDMYIENKEETALSINPGLDASFSSQTTMAWGFGTAQLYGTPTDMYNGGMGGYLTANAVYNGVSAGALNAPEWTVDNRRPLYSYNGAVIGSSSGVTTLGLPYYTPVLTSLGSPATNTYYHPINNSSAARYCHEKNRDINGDGIIDQSETSWYLPSFGDVWVNRTSFPDTYNIWSSSEESNTQAWVVNPATAPTAANALVSKTTTHRVRCVRGASPATTIGAAIIAYTDDTDTKSLPETAGGTTFKVTDPEGQGLTWSVSSSASAWLTINKTTNAAGIATQTDNGSKPGWFAYAAANGTASVRSGTITLTRAGQPQTPARQIMVNQAVDPNNVPTTNMTATAYVGAFWRRAETGERLIRINTTNAGDVGTWTATVAWMDGKWSSGDIVLSTASLPAYPAGFVTVGTDTQQVAGTAQSVTGTSASDTPIYFKIGLKSQYNAAQGYTVNGAPARYAVVILSYNNNTKNHKIYLRQGEDPDYLMRSGDLNGSGVAVADGRSFAARFSPYNLTHPSMTNGGAAVANHPQAAVNGGTFVSYPTQAGVLFQWASTSDVRRAYHPVNIVGTLTNWQNSPASTYWTTLAATHETCPAGYSLSDGTSVNFRRPTDGSTSAANTTGAVASSEMRQSLWLNPQTFTTPDLTNSVWGYYADGFFDRGQLNASAYGSSGAANTAVSVNTADFADSQNKDVAYIGRMFINRNNNATLFFPTAGYRHYSNSGLLQSSGVTGYYWSGSSAGTNSSWYMLASSVGSSNISSFRSNGLSVRCVRP